jgi:hypothetical protein
MKLSNNGEICHIVQPGKLPGSEALSRKHVRRLLAVDPDTEDKEKLNEEKPFL